VLEWPEVFWIGSSVGESESGGFYQELAAYELDHLAADHILYQVHRLLRWTLDFPKDIYLSTTILKQSAPRSLDF
jgi:hypothetical protein